MGSSKRWMAVVFVGALGLGLAGCASSRACSGEILPPDLPDSPEPCTKYCKVWVEPTYRTVPRLVPEYGCDVEVPEVVERVRFREVCVKPAEQKICRTPDTRRDVAVVETSAGGYRWQRDGDCWKYCYVPPSYQWTNKVVGEESIEYMTETAPEYKTIAWTEREVRTRTERTPTRYKVVYEQEVFEPGRWEWRASSMCNGCVQPAPKVCLPFQEKPCRPPVATNLAEGCDPCN